MTAVIYVVSEEIATITLNLPEKLNPISEELQLGFREALQRCGRDRQVRALVITGAGKAFCAGADLSSMQDVNEADFGDRMAALMESLSNPIIAAMRSLPVPVVCAVNGPAVGAGVGIALAADVVIASRSAYFYMPFLPKLGILPDLGCTWQLPRRIGLARAFGMALLDERVSADKAAHWGLIWDSVDDQALMDAATKMAQRLGRMPAHAVEEMRNAFAASERNTLSEQLGYEKERQRELLALPAFREGVEAFAGKRAPVFPSR